MQDEHRSPRSTSREQPAPGEPSLDALLARGERLLDKLEKEAEAARAEARRAQLHVALAEARSGAQDALQAWLLRYDAGNAEMESPPASHFPAPAATPDSNALSVGHPESQLAELNRPDVLATTASEPRADLPAAPSGPPKPSGLERPDARRDWETLLPAARERLQAHAERLRSLRNLDPANQASDNAALRPDAASDAASGAASDAAYGAGNQIRDVRNTGAALRPTSEPRKARGRGGRKTAPSKHAKRDARTSAGFRAKGEQSPQKPKPELLRAIQAGDDEQTSERKPALWRWSGAGASLIAHVLIIVILGLITFKLPAPPASLAFESSSESTSQPEFAMMEPVETAELEEPTEALPTVENRMDLSSNVDALDARVAESLAEGMANPSQGPAGNAASAALAGTGAGIPQAAASFFGAEASGNCFCFVIDSSSSMRGGPWEAAKAELFRSLSGFKDNQRFYIIFFNKKLEALPEVGGRDPAKFALYATPENLRHARQWVDTIRISAGASPAKALEFAVSLDPDAIYLLTDGVTQTDLSGFLRENNRVFDLIDGDKVKVPIHAIAFYSLDGQALLQQVAAENAGQFIYVPDPHDLN